MDRGNVARLRWLLFVHCVSDDDSGSPKISFVPGQPRPGNRSLTHTGVTGTERWAKMRVGGGRGVDRWRGDR